MPKTPFAGEEFRPDLFDRPDPETDRARYREWYDAVQRRRAAWINALMDPEAKQAAGLLRWVNVGNPAEILGECCLGVALRVFTPPERWKDGTLMTPRLEGPVYSGEHWQWKSMPESNELGKWLHLPGDVIGQFAELNDNMRLSFRDIALVALTYYDCYQLEVEIPPLRPDVAPTHSMLNRCHDLSITSTIWGVDGVVDPMDPGDDEEPISDPHAHVD